MFANCQLGGVDNAFPDVCLTPAPPAPNPVPIPYPNIATGLTAIPNVLILGAPIHNLATSIPMTNGDNAGVMLGVASGTVMGPSRHLLGSLTVTYYGMPATRVTSPSLQNSTNAPGFRTVPSQALVTILAP